MTDTATREQVVAELVAESAPQQEQTPAEAQPAEPQDTADDAPEPSAEGDENPTPEEGQSSDLDAPEEPASEEAGEDDAPEPPASEAPHFWPAEMKARFAELPADLQIHVLEAEKAGSKALTQRIEEASLSRKEAESERQVLTELNTKIGAAVVKAEASFKDRWAGMTPERWLKLSQENPEQYVKYRAQFDSEQQALQQAQLAKEEAVAVEREQWRTEQVEALKTLAPELVDPATGPQRLEALGAYLVKQGAREQDLPNVGAFEMSIALKAMKFDELQALKPTPQPKPKAALRPAAAIPATPTKEREIQRLRNRFAQTGDRKDAVALMLAEES